ncbi:MAG: hypothetical protein Q8O23_04240 [Gallionella sp.]|nr:hypothetical protein [Gallionella sp.]
MSGGSDRRRANEIGTASNSAEKKGSPNEGVAEGGGWGEEFRHARAEAKRFRRTAVGGTLKQNNFQFLLRKIWRAGVKKLKENCFALLAEVRRAKTRSRIIRTIFARKRFELRSAIATNSDILKIEGHLVARSPRRSLSRTAMRERGYARIFPYISELNRKGGQIQIQFFGKANGGSACDARNPANGISNFFQFLREQEYKSSFLIPRFRPKATNN